MAGPNDHHIAPSGEILPGLGTDEPSELRKLQAQAAGETASRRLREELAREAGKLDARDLDLAAREQAASLKAAELEAREKALLKAEAEAKATKGAK